MLCAASIMLGLISLRLPSTSLAMNGNAAMTSGTTDAGVPTTVPTISLVSGNTIIINMRNGTERSRLIITFSAWSRPLGTLIILLFSPATSSTPRGRPMMVAKKVESTVT